VGNFMSRLAIGALAVTLMAFAAPAGAQVVPDVEVSVPGSRPPGLFEPRPRTRLRITPLRRAPLDRRAYRQCQDWYDTEHRPSGTVIVPKMRCWWVRG
jgi:hypothetical protein